MKDLSGSRALVVGGTKGIGRATALALAARGAAVTVVGRDPAAGAATASALRAAAGTGEFLAADLSLLSEVRRLAGAVRERTDRLDVVVHSADALMTRRVETAEGLETGFAVNFLSRFLLNQLLADLLRAAAPARIVHVAAAGAKGRFDATRVPPGPGTSAFRGHLLGQHANDVYAVEFAARHAGQGISVSVLNPGFVDTGIRRTDPRLRPLMRLMERALRSRMRTPEQTAAVVVRLATDPDLDGVTGALFGPDGTRLPVPPTTAAPAARAELWARSERAVGAVPAPSVATREDHRI